MNCVEPDNPTGIQIASLQTDRNWFFANLCEMSHHCECCQGFLLSSEVVTTCDYNYSHTSAGSQFRHLLVKYCTSIRFTNIHLILFFSYSIGITLMFLRGEEEADVDEVRDLSTVLLIELHSSFRWKQNILMFHLCFK